MSAPHDRLTSRNLDALLAPFAEKPGLVLGLAVLFLLGPFIGKPFNMDDPLFIWTAQHIQAEPLNPYNFMVNWYGWDQPMWEVTKNPPLVSYYLSVWAIPFGWSEPSLHAALLLPALAVILGTHRLARRFCTQPMLAALLTLVMPVFLVSSTMVMCDVLMLAFWVWAIVLWTEGCELGRPGLLAVAAVLIGLAAMTKYFGACLLPLLAVWSFVREKSLRLWLPWLSIPVVILAAYQIGTSHLYGRGLLLDAGSYVKYTRTLYDADALKRTGNALTFTGGCLAAAIFFAPFLWSRRTFLLGLATIGLLTGWLSWTGWLVEPYASTAGSTRFWLAAQIAVWMVVGISVLALGITDYLRQRDAQSLLLNLWVLGTFAFAAFCNWTVTARTLLPMAPAVGILMLRRWHARAPATRTGILPALALSATLALGVARADFLLATANHENVAQVANTYANENRALWFFGHWGFQYYMQSAGARPVDTRSPQLNPADLVALPLRNTNVPQPDTNAAAYEHTFSQPIGIPIATQNPLLGAGFYASLWGPLPFAFGWPPVEQVDIYRIKVPSPNSPP